MSPNRPPVALVAALVLLSGVASAGRADARTALHATATVVVADDGTLLGLEQAGSAMAGADVSVARAAGADFDGSGDYRTDADGEVRLPAPEGEVTVRLVVETDDARLAGVVALAPPDTGEYRATVELDATAEAAAGTDGEGSASGDAEADANGSVSV